MPILSNLLKQRAHSHKKKCGILGSLTLRLVGIAGALALAATAVNSVQPYNNNAITPQRFGEPVINSLMPFNTLMPLDVTHLPNNIPDFSHVDLQMSPLLQDYNYNEENQSDNYSSPIYDDDEEENKTKSNKSNNVSLTDSENVDEVDSEESNDKQISSVKNDQTPTDLDVKSPNEVDVSLFGINSINSNSIIDNYSNIFRHSESNEKNNAIASLPTFRHSESNKKNDGAIVSLPIDYLANTNVDIASPVHPNNPSELAPFSNGLAMTEVNKFDGLVNSNDIVDNYNYNDTFRHSESNKKNNAIVSFSFNSLANTNVDIVSPVQPNNIDEIAPFSNGLAMTEVDKFAETPLINRPINSLDYGSPSLNEVALHKTGEIEKMLAPNFNNEEKIILPKEDKHLKDFTPGVAPIIGAGLLKATKKKKTGSKIKKRLGKRISQWKKRVKILNKIFKAIMVILPLTIIPLTITKAILNRKVK